VTGISCGILFVLFMVQRFGTDKVGYTFAPIVLVWFLSIGLTGLYNIFKHDPSVLKAFNPAYCFTFFTRNKKAGWISLGGIVLCITGKIYN
jgi:KUP system potassium uptake protein